MNNQEILKYLNSLDLKVYKHASNIIAKNSNWDDLNQNQKIALPIITKQYYTFLVSNHDIVGHSDENIITRVLLLNNYYSFINENNYDNVFSSQGKFRSTILEEFMFLLFKDLVTEQKNRINNGENDLKVGSATAYTNLFFSGINFDNFVQAPQIGVNQKDQDFAIYRPISIAIGDSNAVKTNLPIVAIENKTYIDKTMLEGSIATAEKIKSGNPYSLFFIVAENYDVDLKIDPVYSKINQIYVLRKSKRKGNLQPICATVLIDLVSEVKKHLLRNWSDVAYKMKNTGKII